MKFATGLLLSVSLALTGCAGPFAAKDDDYASRVPVERLRQINTLDLEQYAVPTDASTTDVPVPEEVMDRFADVESVELSLEAARQMVLANNLDLRVRLIDPVIANEAISESEAAFESMFDLRGVWSETDTPTSSTLADAQAKRGSLTPSITVPTRTGGSVTLSLPVSRSETNNSFSTLNPAITTNARFSLSHNLLRGAGRRANTHALRVAGFGQQATEARTKLEAIRQIAAVDRLYWQLYQASEELQVRVQEFELAKEQLARAERRVRAGAVAEVEVLRAQAGVAERLDDIIRAQNTLLERQRAMKQILNEKGLEIETHVSLRPGTPPDPVRYEYDREALSKAAVASRMEMLELEIQLAQDASQIEFNENQALPLLALDYTYQINGLGGSFHDSAEMVRDNRFEDWQLGLTAQIPIGNEAAKSRVRRAILTRLQRLVTRQARELSIRKEVLDAVDNLEAAWQSLLASRQSVLLNTRSLEAEQRQFDEGLSNSTDVLDQSTRLANAQLTEIRSIVAYQISQIDLAFATGTLLGASRVQWQPFDPRDADLDQTPSE